MDEVAAAARSGAPEGFVLIADEQMSGRGRLNRRWETPPGQAIALSVLLRPLSATPELVARIPMAVGLSALDVLDALLPGRCALKWPNDVLLDGLKVAGMLVEVAWDSAPNAEVIMGLGLNVSQAEADLPPGATSVAAGVAAGLAAGGSPSRTELTISILKALEAHYRALLRGEDPLPQWRSRLATIGSDVVALVGVGGGANPRTLRGVAVGVTELGGLCIQLEDGTEEVVVAGDVTLAAGWDSRL